MCAAHVIPDHSVTRRALGVRIAAAAASVGLGGTIAAPAVAAAQPGPAPLDPALREAALRGLALAGARGDAVGAAVAEAAMRRLAETDPEGALIYRLYRKLDVRPASFYRTGMPAAAEADLDLLHRAIAEHRSVRFGYTDLEGNETEREVLPLLLVHPEQGVKLLAFCCKAEDYRQFFIRAMRKLEPAGQSFGEDRLALLTELVEKEGA